VADFIHSIQIMVWKVPDFSPNAVSDPAVYLSPLFAAAYASRDQLPPLNKLKQLYAKCNRRRIHLIFIYRHSKAVSKDHDGGHIRESLAIVTHINACGVDEVVSISIICGRNIKGCFVPSFANDIKVELNLVAQFIAAARRSSESVGGVLSQASRASEFTIRIKSHIIGAVVEGVRPVLVSIGTHAMSHNWDRFSLLFRQLESTYGQIDIWLRMSADEAFGGRRGISPPILLTM